jgi:DNA repair exonuclease SbcCD ATPase subunit
MCIIVYSDLHLHLWKNFGIDLTTSLSKRLLEQKDVLDQIVEIAKEEKAQVAINAGDTFHQVGHIPVEALNVAHLFFEQLSSNNVESIIIDGNHDLSKTFNSKWFHSSVHSFVKHNRLQTELIRMGHKIKIINYYDVVDFSKVVGFDIVVLHKTPAGSRVGNYTFDDGVDWKTLSKNNGLVFFGHIHQNQKLSDNCYVVGSPMHLTFGDEGDRGIYIIRRDLSIEFRKIVSPKFVTVDYPDQIHDDGNYYRVLHSDQRINESNVVSVINPTMYDERIKSENFNSILDEWLEMNNKDKSYLNVIEDILKSKNIESRSIYDGSLISIGIRDFMSIGTIHYKFQNGFTLITGQNEDLDSNGSGKTSFVDAIFWCLFGETTKGLTGNDVIRRGCDDCTVDLYLERAPHDFIMIQRTRSEGLSICIPSEDEGEIVTKGLRQSDRQELLEKMLGFNKKTFLSSCYFSQENLQSLMNFSDSERTNMITDLLGYETYDDLYDKVVEKCKRLESEIDQFNESKVEVDKSIAVVKSKVEYAEECVDENKKRAKLIKESISKYDNEIANIKVKLSELEDEIYIESDVDYENALKDLYDSKEETSKSIKSVNDYEKSLRRELVEKRTNAASKKSYIEQYLRSAKDLESEIKKLDELEMGERCDKCGSTITEENAQCFIEDKRLKIDDLELSIDSSQKDLDKDESYIFEIDDRIERSEKKLIELQTTLTNTEGRIRKTLGEKEKALKLKQAIEVNKQKLMNDITTNESIIKNCKDQIKSYEESAVTAENSVTVLNSKLEELEDKLKKSDLKIEEIKKSLLILDFWKLSFSNKGIRSVLLDKFCNQFNSYVNEYLSISSNGYMSILLNSIKTLKSGEERNKLELQVSMGKDVVRYDSLSGGEKRRCDISICLALNKWLSEKHSLKSGILGIMIFDELFSFLDRVGEENIGTLLYNEGLNRKILVISHTPELSSYSSNMISIIKRDGISSLNEGVQ